MITQEQADRLKHLSERLSTDNDLWAYEAMHRYIDSLVAAAPTPPVQQDDEQPAVTIPERVHDIQCAHATLILHFESAEAARRAYSALDDRHRVAVNCATKQDDEALEVLRELVEARDEFTGAGDPQAIRSAGQRIRTAEAAARALLTKRGAA